jgi:hypothetical protein
MNNTQQQQAAKSFELIADGPISTIWERVSGDRIMRVTRHHIPTFREWTWYVFTSNSLLITSGSAESEREAYSAVAEQCEISRWN